MSKPGKVILLLAVAAGAFSLGVWYNQRKSDYHITPTGRHILYYHDPMHPAYKSDKPGIAPDCGMQLEPVYADGGQSGSLEPHEPMPGGMVQISPEKQQIIGVKIEEVKKASEAYAVRVLGRVALDETRIFRVTVPVDGLVRTAGPIATGSIVRKDEVLATFYNRDFLTAQQTYLYALNTMDRSKDKESEEQLKLTKAQMRAAEENLEFLGMGEIQLQEIARTRQIARNIELRSPFAGLVLARNAFAGLRFERGTELFRISALNHIWIYADIFENDSQLIHAAKSARVRYQGRSFPVRLSNALPQFDPASRALKVRLEMDNPNFVLRPDMFVDVEFQVGLPSGIIVPVDAVLDTGLKKTVFIDHGNGYFEPRKVETGARLGDRVFITSGLAPGDHIVVSGNFLIDSESRMKAASQPQPRPKPHNATAHQDPVCGMDIEPSKSVGKSEYRGKTYFFCSRLCKEKFDKNTEQYVGKTAAGRTVL